MPETFRMKIVSKRQVTMPEELLKLLHLSTGDELQIEVAPGGGEAVVTPLKVVPTSLFTPEILRKLDEREAEIDAGKFVEIRDASQLRKKRPARSRG